MIKNYSFKSKYLFYLSLFLALIFLQSCSENESEAVDELSTYFTGSTEEGAVKIEGKNNRYWMVTIDYTKTEYTHYQIGQQYGRCIKKIVPDYEEYVGGYLAEILFYYYFHLGGATIPNRIKNIKQNLEQNYIDEIDGLVSEMKGYGIVWTAYEEMYGFNLIPDIFRTTQCSGFGVWGDKSKTGSCIAYRTLDWFGGANIFNWSSDLLSSIQCITKLKFADKTVYTFGALGHVGCITGINSNTRIMGAILDAPLPNTTYSSDGIHSYNFDLRYALESAKTTDEIVNQMNTDKYAYNHLILLADMSGVRFLENNITKGEGYRRVRQDTSTLFDTKLWNYPQMIAAVNCFMLNGQPNNFSEGECGPINTERWSLLLSKTASLLKTNNNQLGSDDVKSIMCSYRTAKPRSLLDDHGDLYNQQTQQMMIYIPFTNYLEVFFKPGNGSTPTNPKDYFFQFTLE